MMRLLEKKPILHAVLWILLYIVLMSIGEILSEAAGVANSVTSAILVVFSVALVLYMRKNQRLGYFGIQPVTKEDLRKTLFYIPLIVLAFSQYASGIDSTLSAAEIALFCLLMAGVGLIEEVIFRGFLYQAIRESSGVNRAIVISGITFGIGHIVNLLRGYSAVDQVQQILMAVAIGVMLALLVAITRTILPGVLFHAVFNIGGSISNAASGQQTQYMIAILAVTIGYALYLYRVLRSKQKAGPAREQVDAAL